LTSITHPVMKLPGIIRSQERIPMSGFYEWRQMEDGKQPFFISGKESPVLSVAGLWDNWKNCDTGETLRSCTMIVTEANPFMSDIHDRMPVFLAPDRLDSWLTGEGWHRDTLRGLSGPPTGLASVPAGPIARGRQMTTQR
jgi:putative SOS response-associated peptidase YedK